MNVSEDEMNALESGDPDPEGQMLKKGNAELVRPALEELPVEFREIIVMRELEGLSYKEIAEIAAIPIGTVMTRLARARTRLQQKLDGRLYKEAAG